MDSEKFVLPAHDLDDLRIEQARMLKDRVLGSCLVVEFVIMYTAIIMALVDGLQTAAIWFTSATFMVGITYAYAKTMAPDGITRDNFGRYLRGHILVSAATGAIWSGFAIYQIDFTSEYTIFLACLIVSSITMGGVLPSSAYRPGYIGLAVFAVPPVGFYLAVAGPSAFRFVGIGMLVYFLFTMYISARVEIDTRETIAARNARQLNEKVIAQNEMIQRASEEKTRFLAATSHDLSQPLQAQGFFMQTLREMLSSADQRDMLDKIEDSWRSQRQLLQGIVDVTRIDSGAIVPRHTMVHLTNECEKLANEFASDQSKLHNFLTDFDDIHSMTDPVLFARIVRNILQNAKKFTPAGGTIEFSLKRHDGLAKITICDNGPGISEQDQERVFDEYIQLEETGGAQPAGIGLGLSIVQRLCTLLDMGLSLESHLGNGATFCLSMKIDRIAKDIPVEQNHSITLFPNSPLVIVVDDEPAVRESMTAVLSSWSCQVMSSASSPEALSLVSRTSVTPALLIIDKRLGRDDDGLGLIYSLREEINANTPAILMSGNLGDLDEDGLGQNITFMNKPVDPEEIRNLMVDLLQSNEMGKSMPGQIKP